MPGNEQHIEIKQIYEEILKSRNEIKRTIEASEVRLLLKIEQLTNSLRDLERENSELRSEVEILKREGKKNNILVFGLNTENKDINANYICKELKSLIGIELKESQLNDTYPLGTSNNRPVKIEFTSYLTKKTVLKNCSKLKGTSISIVNDLTPQQRHERKILRKHMTLAKQDNKTCYIKNNKLYVEEIVYTVEDLLQCEIPQKPKINSAPSTPSVSNEEIPRREIPDENTLAEDTRSTPKPPISRKHLARAQERSKTRSGRI